MVVDSRPLGVIILWDSVRPGHGKLFHSNWRAFANETSVSRCVRKICGVNDDDDLNSQRSVTLCAFDDGGHVVRLALVPDLC